MTSNNTTLFKHTFKALPTFIARAPGRLEVLGNHTDYNEGFVLSCAVAQNTEISFRPIDGKTCQIVSQQMDHKVQTIDLDQIEPGHDKEWLNYPKGILYALKQCDKHLKTAFQACITTTLPLSSGMSSSAALEIAFLAGIDHLLKLGLSLKDKARLGQICENKVIGANTGLMDQLSVLASQKDHLLLSEYRHLELKQIPFPNDICFVVVNSHIQHDLTREYNERRIQCEQALKALQKSLPGAYSLRDIDLKTLEQHKPELNQLEYLRARHVVSENQRVHDSIDALKHHRIEDFGRLLFQSHQSSTQNFENSCPELDFLIEHAKQSSLCMGARLSGGGFGGISLHLLKREHTKVYSAEINQAFCSKYGQEPQILVCTPSDGAFIKELG